MIPTIGGLALIIAKLVGYGGVSSYLIMGTEWFNRFHFDPKNNKRGGFPHGNPDIESLREKIRR